jgi:hypothetical protein
MAMVPDTVSPSESENVGLLSPFADSDVCEKDFRRARQRTLFVRPSPWFLLTGVLVVSLIANATQLWLWLRSRAVTGSCKSPLSKF